MDSTSFVLDAGQMATRAAVHVKDGDGHWFDAGDIVNRTDPEWWAGGHGLLPFITPEALQLYLDYETALYAAL